MKLKKKIPQLVRDISWLAFNERVLQEAQDNSNHLYNRLKFLGIFSNNLDEFFRVRVATLKRMVLYGKKANVHLESEPTTILNKINLIVEEQQIVFRRTYLQIIKELNKKNIFIKNERQLNREQKHFVKQYFYDEVYPNIVPLMISSMPNVPLLKDRSIYLACTLVNSMYPELVEYALIEIPTHQLNRFIILPEAKNEEKHLILLEDIIRYNLPNIFAPFGYDDCSGHIIKLTRDAELDIDNDININIITAIENGLKNRKKGQTTRFIYDRNIDEGILKFLIKKLGLGQSAYMNKGGRVHNFKDFIHFPSSVFDDIPSTLQPFIHHKLVQPCSIFNVLEQGDILLHFPFHSFDSIIDMLREAAIDPHVKSIKITAYRLANNSQIANALINAVKNGKKVDVYLELRARFDEAANLGWKNKFEEEGVNVYVGITNMKVHAKICIIERCYKNKKSRYGFLSTGNFNENTAQQYTDTCLLTTNKSLLSDADKIFDYLIAPKSLDALKKCKKMVVAPINLRNVLLQCIEQEIKNAKKKKPAEIILKLNSLVDEILIDKLYEAAVAGVVVSMSIRGICCAITKNKLFKENIKAISIVDNYLEHSRIVYFNNNNNPRIFLSSADWMVRNLDHRVECAFEVDAEPLKEELMDMLAIEFSENVKARILDNKQKNEYVRTGDVVATFRSQEKKWEYLYCKE